MMTQSTSIYLFKRACKLMIFGGAETSSSARAKFILPEMNKLSKEIKSGSLEVLLVSCADSTNSEKIDLTEDPMVSTSCVTRSYDSNAHGRQNPENEKFNEIMKEILKEKEEEKEI